MTTGKKKVSAKALLTSLLYGLVNVVLSIPALYGYSAVIFAHPAFVPWSALLAKMVVLSSAVHQICFLLWSALPYAIGQVQDAGLIFLSKIASGIATDLRAQGGSTDAIVLTSCVTLSTCTAILGWALVVFGRQRLTYVVSFLPLPVLSGYLAFIGAFCVEAGLGLCVGGAVQGPATWSLLWTPSWNIVLTSAGLVGGAFLCFVSRRYQGGDLKRRNDLALPFAIVGLLVLFYVIVFCVPGYSLADARTDGWLRQQSITETNDKPSLSSLFFHKKLTIRSIFLEKIWWWTGLKHGLKTLPAMICVVALSSCLDVAAIEMQIGRPLNMDAELAVVGKANVVAGLCGGFTGSYIFSQTIFTCRVGSRSRVVGSVVVFAEIAVVLSKCDLLQLLPSYWFASTLTFIGIDLMIEWLIESRSKFPSHREYLASLGTFLAIQVAGLDTGLVFGLGFAAIVFLLNAATTEKHLHAGSSLLVRTQPHPRRAISSTRDKRRLEKLKDRIVVLQLRGILWWGTAHSIYTSIRRALKLDDDGGGGLEDDDENDEGNAAAPEENESSLLFSKRRQGKTIRRRPQSTLPVDRGERSLLLTASPPPPGQKRRLSDRRGFHVILDLHQVDGIDASAIRTLFVPLCQLAKAGDAFGLGLAGIGPATERLFAANGAPLDESDNIAVFAETADAVDWAQTRQLASVPQDVLDSKKKQISAAPVTKVKDIETQEKRKAMLSQSLPDRDPKRSGLFSGLALPRYPASQPTAENDCLSLGAARFIAKQALHIKDIDAAVATLRQFCPHEISIEAQASVFDAGDDASHFFCLLTGEVKLLYPTLDLESGRPHLATLRASDVVRPAGFFGFVDPLTSSDRPTRSFVALARTPVSLAVFAFADLDLMFQSNPTLVFTLQRALLRQSALELVS